MVWMRAQGKSAELIFQHANAVFLVIQGVANHGCSDARLFEYRFDLVCLAESAIGKQWKPELLECWPKAWIRPFEGSISIHIDGQEL